MSVENVRRRAMKAPTLAALNQIERQFIEVFGEGTPLHQEFLQATEKRRIWLKKHDQPKPIKKYW